MAKRVNTKQLAKEKFLSWGEMDCIRQTAVLSLADACKKKGLNKEQTENYIVSCVSIVLNAMLED